LECTVLSCILPNTTGASNSNSSAVPAVAPDLATFQAAPTGVAGSAEELLFLLASLNITTIVLGGEGEGAGVLGHNRGWCLFCCPGPEVAVSDGVLACCAGGWAGLVGLLI